jgi:Tfp pilus assembly protein PilO
MINFRDKDQLPSLVIFGLSGVILLGAVVLAVLPKPTAAPVIAKDKKDRDTTIAKIENDRQSAKDATVQVLAQSFPGPAQTVEKYALTTVSGLTSKHKIKLTGIRPQRGNLAGDLTQLPFLVNVTGSYLDVIAFERDLEQPGNKLGVNSVQLAASDPSTDIVVANINIVAYLNLKLSAGELDG